MLSGGLLVTGLGFLLWTLVYFAWVLPPTICVALPAWTHPYLSSGIPEEEWLFRMAWLKTR